MELLNNAIEYPRRTDDWITRILIGGVLLFFSFLLLPVFLVYGYVVRAIRGTIEGSETPPEFDDWGDMFVDGIQAAVILILFSLVPFLVGIVVLGVSFLLLGADSGALSFLGIVGVLVGGLLTFLLVLAAGYVGVAAVTLFAREDRFGAAFDVDGLKTLVSNREFAVAWIVGILVVFAAGLVGIIPIVGWILVPFAEFFAFTAAANAWGTGYLKATGAEPAEPGSADDVGRIDEADESPTRVEPGDVDGSTD